MLEKHFFAELNSIKVVWMNFRPVNNISNLIWVVLLHIWATILTGHHQLTKAGCAVEGHVPDDSGPKARPHQQELLCHLLQAPGPLACHLESTFPWEKGGRARDGGVELTSRSTLGLNPQERKNMSTSQLFNLPPGTRLPIELLSVQSKTLSGQLNFTSPYLAHNGGKWDAWRHH